MSDASTAPTVNASAVGGALTPMVYIAPSCSDTRGATTSREASMSVQASALTDRSDRVCGRTGRDNSRSCDVLSAPAIRTTRGWERACPKSTTPA